MEEQGREQPVGATGVGVQELAQTGGVWATLRSARESHGMTIAEVARYLKLTPRQIEAMEAGDLSHLPEVTFARGFIRNYARLLKLDPQPLLAGLEPVRETVLPPTPARLGNMPGPRAMRFSAWPAAAACLALFALLCAAWYYGWFEPRDEQFLSDVVAQSEPQASAPAALPAPPATSEAAVEFSAPVAEVSVPLAQSSPAASAPVAAPPAISAPLVTAPSAPAAAPAAASVPASQAGQVRLVFSFEVEAWVEVRDGSGRIVFSRLNQAGSTQEVLGAGPLALTVGNAPGVKLVANGRPVDLAQYTKSTVARLTLP